MQYDLFISHSSADAAAARALVTEFENRGIRCWLAARDIAVGASYQAEIIAALERCRAILLVFSDAANRSEHILREVQLAEQEGKPLYPLRIGGAQPAGGLKYMLANKQWVEREALGNRLVDKIEQLLASIGDTSRASDQAPRQEPAPRSSKAPLMIGAAALALILAAGGLAWQSGLLAPRKPATAVAPEPPVAVVVPQDTPVPAQPPAPAGGTVVPATVTTSAPPSTPSDVARGAPRRAQVFPGKPYLFQECDICPVMAAVPAGSNLLGSPDYERGHDRNEGPQQEVVIGQPFAVGRSEVSFAEWLACVAEGGCNAYRPGDYGWGYGLRPVINVSWADARAYVEWLSRKTGAEYRLLSEAEWEYAARGCVTTCRSTPFWFGMDISKDRANYDSRFAYENSPKATPLQRTAEILSAEPNSFGLLHIHGNVREWVEDCWNPTLGGLPRDGSARLTGDCQTRVVRGGSWADEPKDLRSASRRWEIVAERRAQIGFRVARTLAP
jgi:formylglycine-generating enzyme required for sulfatase activity